MLISLMMLSSLTSVQKSLWGRGGAVTIYVRGSLSVLEVDYIDVGITEQMWLKINYTIFI